MSEVAETKRLIETTTLKPVYDLLTEREPRNRLFAYYLSEARVLVDDVDEPSVVWALNELYPFPMLEARTLTNLRTVTDSLPLGNDYAFVGSEMVPLLVADREVSVDPAILYDLPDSVEVPEPNNCFPPLKQEFAEMVAKVSWDAPEYAEYIRQRIERWPSFALYNDGKPVAWNMCHSPDCLGVMHILPEFRGRGLAKQMTRALIHAVRLQGGRPYVQVFESNTPSRNLTEGMGFVEVDRISWITYRGSA
jgi:GNAT superfamily N-acetyltransferase